MAGGGLELEPVVRLERRWKWGGFGGMWMDRTPDLGCKGRRTARCRRRGVGMGPAMPMERRKLEWGKCQALVLLLGRRRRPLGSRIAWESSSTGAPGDGERGEARHGLECERNVGGFGWRRKGGRMLEQGRSPWMQSAGATAREEEVVSGVT
jgi:hypothetical protein